MSKSIIPLFPALYKLNNKKVYQWTVSLIPEGETIDKLHILTQYGYVGGSLIEKTKTLEKGKASRSLLEQATLEAKSKWTDKKEKELYTEENPLVKSNSLESGEMSGSIISQPKKSTVRPMLAHTFSSKKPCSFPKYVQRKYDGIRCIAYLGDGSGGESVGVILESRNGVAFPHFQLLKTQLSAILSLGVYLDGELYTDEIPFETLSGLIRSKKISDVEKTRLNIIQYHIYDVYDSNQSNLPFILRMEALEKLLLPTTLVGSNSLIRKVETEIVVNMEQILEKHAQYVASGYEGIMIRHLEGPYETDKRSKYLQKYKEFLEEEFEIIGFHQGDAGELGCVIWDCKTNVGNKQFAVRPRGTFEQRKKNYLEGSSFIGKKITVIFQEYSQDGIPRFPVGKAIREDY